MKRISDEEIKKYNNPWKSNAISQWVDEWDIEGLLKAQLDSCEKELAEAKIIIADPDQSFPECPYSYKGWTQYEESICKNAYQQMKDEGWVKVVREKDNG